MTDTPAHKQQPLWRQTLTALRELIAAEWQWATVFALLMVAVHLLDFYPGDLDVIKQNPDNYLTTHPEIVLHFGIMTLIQIAPCLPAYYFFSALYLQRTTTPNPPEVSVKNFLFWFGKSLQKYLLLLVPLLVTIVLMGAGVVVKQIGESMAKNGGTAIALPDSLMILGPALGCLTFFFYYYCAFRLCLVTPLAVSGTKTALRDSIRLTKNQCWRIFCEAFVLSCALLALFLLPILAEVALGKNLGTNSVHATIVAAFITGIQSATIAIAYSVFYCIVARTLRHEQPDTTTLFHV